jgi:hypothetical protein
MPVRQSCQRLASAGVDTPCVIWESEGSCLWHLLGQCFAFSTVSEEDTWPSSVLSFLSMESA